MPLSGLDAGVGCPSWPCWLWSTSMRFRRQEGGAAGLACRGPEHPIDTQLQDQAEDDLDGAPIYYRGPAGLTKRFQLLLGFYFASGRAMESSLTSLEQHQILIDLLKENGGRLGNINARRCLSEKLQCDFSVEDYERLKVQLISIGAIRKAQGRGGAIELLPGSIESVGPRTDNAAEPGVDPDERVETLFTSLNSVPGIRVKKNKSTITVLCGEDNDKLFCGWARRRAAYFISYRIEKGKPDCTETAEASFREASADIPYASVERFLNTTSLYLCDNVAQINRVTRRLSTLLESVTLHNGPTISDPPGKPRNDAYYLEIATLIKFCVDNNLAWPLKNWRKTLGFDDVDELIVIGRSPNWHNTPIREHVVPVCLIREEAKNLAEKGAPAAIIAEFIRCHLLVVIISDEEANLLNRTTEKGFTGLKNTMPEGWVWGCHPLQRLRSAGITINIDLDAPPIPEWKPWKGPRIRDKIRGALNTPIFRV